METPTIVRQTKTYMLVKIPLPRQAPIAPLPAVRGETRPMDVPKMNKAQKQLWGIIRDGEQEYQTGKTIRARSIDEALKLHGRKKN